MLTASRSAPDAPSQDSGLTTATINYTRGDRHTVLGETTEAPGLLVAPAIRNGAFTGAWQVVHARSGLKLPAFSTYGLAHAREYAAMLASPEIDWTRTEGEVRADERALAAVRRIVWNLDTAVGDGRPLWWARWSLERCAPVWTITDYDIYLSHGDFAWLTRVLDNRDDLSATQISYDPAPTWRMRCAAPWCAATVSFYDDGCEPCSDARTTCRRELIRIAREQRWHRHEPGRWTCPGCTHAHRSTAPADLSW
ncbi:hypothetical protein [Amycolatopsis magusensis]|uniref:hypothetical protein n=1 Tax=Amycolatopsis magusensis TaxID=882444 RepID=UPI0024A99FC0|nr:hypothetical protein [Amycolatopsis magusensis]MDI5980109.1 hypothetical protein [Amycolatopsis magusensis]